MGWFSNIFKKEQAEESVSFSELGKWVEKKARPDYEAVEKDANVIFSEVEPLRKSILQKLENLANLELRNEQIQGRLKNFMSGNRDNYILQVKIFLNTLPALSEYYFEQIQTALDNFAKHSARSYAILQEFFSNETKDIAGEVKKIDDISRRIDSIYKSSKIAVLNEIKNKIVDAEEKSAKKEQLKQSIALLEGEIVNLDKEVDKLKLQVEEKRQSADAAELKKLMDDKALLEARMKNLDFGFNDMFSPLKRALRKYSRYDLEHEKLIDAYTSSPLHALLKDPDMKITDILEKMKTLLKSITLDEAEQKKLTQRIDMFTSEKLRKTVESYRKDEANLQVLQDEVGKKTIAQEIMDGQEKVIAVNAMIEKKQKQILEQKKEFDTIDVQKDISLVAQLAESAFGAKLNITL